MTKLTPKFEDCDLQKAHGSRVASSRIFGSQMVRDDAWRLRWARRD